VHQLAYGLTIDCDLDLGLPATDAAPAADVVVRQWQGDPGPVLDGLRAVEGSPSMSMVVCDRHFVVGFGDDAVFAIGASGTEVWWADVGVDLPTLVHLLLDQVLPRVAARRGHLVLHGSSVADGSGNAIVVLGQSGRGKSTLAAGLVARGFVLLSDDCVVLDADEQGATVVPSYPGHRLSPRSLDLVGWVDDAGSSRVSRHSDKLRVAGEPSPVMPEPARLQQLVVLLDPNDSRSVEGPLGPAERAVALLQHSFHLCAPEERVELVARAAAFGERSAVSTLCYEQTESGFDRSISMLARMLQQPGS
jgi:hypothetical protein